MNQKEHPKCEICGRPTVVIVTDTEPDFHAVDIWINAKQPHDELHFFCDEHKRESIHYEGWPTK